MTHIKTSNASYDDAFGKWTLGKPSQVVEFDFDGEVTIPDLAGGQFAVEDGPGGSVILIPVTPHWLVK